MHGAVVYGDTTSLRPAKLVYTLGLIYHCIAISCFQNKLVSPCYIYCTNPHMDSTLITTTTTMRISIILLALAVGAAALPTPDPDRKHALVGGPSHFSFSFSSRLPFFAQLVDRW
jgi:hypothetical protein